MTLMMQKTINLNILDKERHEDGIGMGQLSKFLEKDYL